MIKTFADKTTADFFATGKSRRFPPDLLRRMAMRLEQLHQATTVEDLRMPPSNRLESLGGDRAGQWSIRVNDQWRLCFRFADGAAYEVGFCDYH